MAVVIRLKRTGAKGRPFYRVVVADSRYPRDGRFIEQLGYYDPLTNPSTFKVDAEKFANWVRNGAKPSESVAVMMAKVSPEALRPAPLAKPEAPAPSAADAPAAKKKTAKKKVVAKKKTAAKKKAVTKGSAKKLKARAKAKANKGKPAKPKAAKKAKK
jgi:small subunit ribosomal protein S16